MLINVLNYISSLYRLIFVVVLLLFEIINLLMKWAKKKIGGQCACLGDIIQNIAKMGAFCSISGGARIRGLSLVSIWSVTVGDGRRPSAMDELQIPHRSVSIWSVTVGDGLRYAVGDHCRSLQIIWEPGLKGAEPFFLILIGQLLTRGLRGKMICRRLPQTVPDIRFH